VGPNYLTIGASGGPGLLDHCQYVPLVPRVLILFASIQQLKSVEPPDSALGWMTEGDVAFWVSVAQLDPTGAASRPRGLTWFLPYIFVDNPLALTTGREVYGYPKEQGTFVIPRAWTMRTSSASIPTSGSIAAPIPRWNFAGCSKYGAPTRTPAVG
jgi:hypothetical protein